MINDRLSDCFAALADPTRRAIVARLSQGELTVNELAEPFAISLPAISRHLKVLEQAGLISRSRTAQQRPAKFEPQAIKAIADWVDQYRIFWDGSFDRLDAYLKDLGANNDGK